MVDRTMMLAYAEFTNMHKDKLQLYMKNAEDDFAPEDAVYACGSGRIVRLGELCDSHAAQVKIIFNRMKAEQAEQAEQAKAAKADAK